MKTPKVIKDLTIQNYESIEDDKALIIGQKWLSIFCPAVTSFRGLRRCMNTLWEKMIGDFFQEEAQEEYERHAAPSYYIMEDNFGENEKVIYVSRTKPIKNSHGNEVHIFPKNFAWCMTYSHEDGYITPIFSKNKEYEKLEKMNLKSIAEMESIRF